MTTSRRRAARLRLREIDLYSPEDSSGIDLRSVKAYIGSLLPTVSFKVLPPFLRSLPASRLDERASTLASARVKDPSKSHQEVEPMYGEIEYERRTLLGKAKVGGIVYDGRVLERICAGLLARKKSLGTCSIMLTQRLLSTYSHDDMRHHLRTLVCGFPSLISLPGIVEAPAKPREYYVAKQQLEAAGAGDYELAKLRSAFRGRFIDYDDPSMNEVLKGLVLQAVVFHLTLRPFCDDRTCRLFNAHWQEDLIESQLRSGGLCSTHSKLLDQLRASAQLTW